MKDKEMEWTRVALQSRIDELKSMVEALKQDPNHSLVELDNLEKAIETLRRAQETKL